MRMCGRMGLVGVSRVEGLRGLMMGDGGEIWGIWGTGRCAPEAVESLGER